MKNNKTLFLALIFSLLSTNVAALGGRKAPPKYENTHTTPILLETLVVDSQILK